MNYKTSTCTVPYFSMAKGVSTGSVPQSLIMTSVTGRSFAPVFTFSTAETTSCKQVKHHTKTFVALGKKERRAYHSFENLPKHDMPTIQPLGLDCCNEELGPIGILASISHTHPTWTLMLQFKVLVRKLVAIDTFAWT